MSLPHEVLASPGAVTAAAGPVACGQIGVFDDRDDALPGSVVDLAPTVRSRAGHDPRGCVRSMAADPPSEASSKVIELVVIEPTMRNAPGDVWVEYRATVASHGRLERA